MDAAYLTFLYALAGLSMAFVGFSTIVVTLRQTTGQSFTALQVLTTTQYIELGLLAAGFSMLPPLLAVCSVPDDLVWRISSLVILGARVPFFVVYPKRRKLAAPEEALPPRFLVNAAIFALIAIALALNVIGVPYAPRHEPVIVAASHTLLVAVVLFVRTFSRFLDARPG